MRNDKAEYERAGKLASQATIHGDAATADSWTQWMLKAVACEAPEDRAEARRAYDAAYKATRELDMRWKRHTRRD